MFIYNVTINVEASIRDAWLEWMQSEHIPEMLATGKFKEARLCRVLVDEETGGVTYAVQYLTPSVQLLQEYYREDAVRMRQKGVDLFGDQCVAFRTELELVSQHK
jgi:hypothetical protein